MLRSHFVRIIAVTAIILFVIAGCGKSPTSPQIGNPTDTTESRQVEGVSSHQCLGYYTVTLNRDNSTVEIEPWREADLHLNLTKIFVNTMGLHIAVVPSESDPSNGLFALDFTLTHPLGGHPEYTAFDVRGIVMAPGTMNVGTMIFSAPDETQLENPDGYTRWWNPTEFTQPGIFGYTDGLLTNTTAANLTATVNPFKYFADALSPTDDLNAVPGESLTSPVGRLLFSNGSSNTRRHLIRFPMTPTPDIVFGYVIDGCWDLPSPNPPVSVPSDFPMAANQPEAYYTYSHTTFNTLYYDTESGTGGGRLRLQANVYDWQGQDSGDVAAEVGDVMFYSPDLFSGGVSADFLSEVSHKARYGADLTGLTTPTHAGEIVAATKIESSDGPDYDQEIGYAAPDEPIAAWNKFTFDVVDPDCSADDDNDFAHATAIDLENITNGQLCASTDALDYYSFEIPPGSEISGKFVLYCDANPTRFAFFDGSHTKLIEVYAINGSAEIDLDSLDLMPGTQFVRIYTETVDRAFLYTIEPDIEFTNVSPSNPTNVTPDGLFLSPKYITSHGNYVYASGENATWIYDFTDPANPLRLSETRIDCGIKPALVYPYLYYYSFNFGGDQTVTLIDVSDPSNPVVEPVILTLSGEVYALQAEPGYLYVAYDTAPNYDVNIYDISSNPATPAYVNSIVLTYKPIELTFHRGDSGPDYWLGVLYDHQDVSGFFNITDKMTIPLPDYVAWAAGDQVIDFISDGDYIFSSIQNGTNYYFESVVLDTGGIVYKGGTSTSDKPVAMDRYHDSVFIACEEGWYDLVDVIDPDNPSEYNDYSPYVADYKDITLQGLNILFAMGDAGIGVVDALSLFEYDPVIGLGRPNDYSINGDYMYDIESDGEYYGMKVTDISDPASAHVVSGVETYFDYPSGIASDGTRLVVSTNMPNLLAYDISDPLNVTYLNNIALPAMFKSMAIHGDVLYYGSSTPSIESYDLSGWPVISLSSSIPLFGNPRNFAFKGNVLYVNTGVMVELYDISNPLIPAILPSLTPSSPPKNIKVWGNYLLIATANDLVVIDITTPDAPAYLASEPDPNAPDGEYLALDGVFAILQPYETAVPTVMLIWPPDDPSWFGPLYGPEHAIKPNFTFTNNGYYYEIYPEGPMRIWDLY